MDADVIVVGAGLSGLVAATELADAGKRVVVLDQEGPQSLGGQAFWSLGGLFLVDTPEQRRLGIRDSLELARQDWFGAAGFDREEDAWPRRWAEAYLAFAAGEKRAWLRGMGVRIFPIVGWAERGGTSATGHGNSAPRFHVAWGAGPGVLEPFVRRARASSIGFRFRHRVDALEVEAGRVVGVSGMRLAEDEAPRGVSTSRQPAGEFRLTAQAVVVASGGIGGAPELVRQAWPARLGAAPAELLSGTPEHVDGRMMGIAAASGARLVNGDRLWCYVEGLKNWDPIWPRHAIRILPGPSSLWLDAEGRRLPPHLYPGADTLGQLQHIAATGYDWSWFVLNQSILRKEFALSGSEQNPDLTARDWRLVLGRVFGRRATGPVEAFKQKGEDFVVRDDLQALVEGMNALTGRAMIDADRVAAEVAARDRQLANPFTKDHQLMAIRNARRSLGERLARTAPPHRLLDPAHGPLIAVRLHIMTRKTLGGLETDLEARAVGPDGAPVPGLYAVGEAAGFGGGGMHGYRALEGSFLGGCLFTGLQAGRALASAL